MKNIRFGTIGTNFISDTFAEAVALTDYAEIVSVYSRSHETGSAFAAKHGIACDRVFTDFESFAGSGIDAVYIASPNSLHAKQSIYFLERGIHVLCEKPAASDLAEYLTMHEASVKGGAVLLEAMRPAHDPSWQVISDALPQIRRIRHAAFEFCQYSSRYGRHMAGEHVNTFDPSFSNAALMDIGVYPLHCIVMLFGAPDEVTAKSVFLPDGFEASGEALLRYGSMTASAHYSKIYDSTRPSAIFGEDGEILIDKLSFPHAAKLRLRTGEERTLPIEPVPNNLVWEIRDFCELVERGDTDHRFARVTESVMRVLNLARAETGIIWDKDRI